MAPELMGEQKDYDGTKVDIFALGQVLYTMMFANHAFWKSTDAHYNQLMANPRAAMKKRGLECSEVLLDLMVGMLNPDAEKRYNLNQINSHPWFQGS